MLNKKINPNKNRVAAIAALAITGAVAFNMVALQSCKSKNWEVKEGKQEVLTMADKMPQFNGDLMKYLGSQMKYPEAVQKAGVEGRVAVKFVVADDGSVKDAMIVNSNMKGTSTAAMSEAAKLLGDEALRVVNAMPKWIPGEKNGKKVAVYYTLPVSFMLGNDDAKNKKTVVSDNAKVWGTEAKPVSDKKSAKFHITGTKTNKESSKEEGIAEAQELLNKIGTILENDGGIPMHENGQISVAELDAELERVTKNKK
jgi:TonB family protein